MTFLEPQMHTDAHGSRHGDLNLVTEQVIGCTFEVHNELGCGFLEKVYENALVHACRKAGLKVEQQVQIKVIFDGVVVGDYIVDMIVEGDVLIELKAVQALTDIHKAQCLNYLKATGLPVCLLMNFAKPKVEVKRLAL
ncbi:MAG: GxxExxY protein [Planctomycetota bacterium]